MNLEDEFALIIGEEIDLTVDVFDPRIAQPAAGSVPVLTGSARREVCSLSSSWSLSKSSLTVELTIYLLAFGFGFGASLVRSAVMNGRGVRWDRGRS